MVSGGPKSTWAVELCGGPCAVDRLVLRHWTGKAWQAVPQPADSAKTGTQWPDLAVPPGSKDVFAFYDEYRNFALPNAVPGTTTVYAYGATKVTKTTPAKGVILRYET